MLYPPNPTTSSCSGTDNLPRNLDDSSSHSRDEFNWLPLFALLVAVSQVGSWKFQNTQLKVGADWHAWCFNVVCWHELFLASLLLTWVIWHIIPLASHTGATVYEEAR